jgi:hypothetical protein
MDPFETELCELLAETRVIADDGFSARVMNALPPRRTRRSFRLPILVGMTALGWIVSMVILPGGKFVHDLLALIPNSGWLATIPIHWLLALYLICWMVVSAVVEERSAVEPARPAAAS